MRTLLSTMIATILAGNAFAGDPVTPVAPTIPNLVTVSQTAVAALTEETTNRVFIDQSGNNPNVNITQDGSGNKVGSNPGKPIYLRGIGQNVVIIQSGAGSASGNNNTVDLQVVNAFSGAGVGANVTIRQLGNSNTVDAVCGDSTTGCDKANINWLYTGNNNDIYFRAKGSELTSDNNFTGNNNTVNSLMVGNKHTQIVNVDGNYNDFNLSQTSTGGAGSSIVINQQGSNSTYNISQSGSVDNVVDIKSIAVGGNFNIVQHN